MAAHSWWRVFFTSPPTDRVVIDLLQFYDASSTLIPTTGGTVSASSTQGGSSPANAFDGSVNGSWWIGNLTSVTPATPEWLAYHFSSAVDVASFALAPRQLWQPQWPMDFALQYSDDGIAWTTLGQYYGANYPGNSGTGTQSWTCNAANAVPALGIAYRLLITATQTSGNIAAIMEWKLFDATSTQIATTRIAAPSSSFASSEGDGGYAAFDGSTSTYWASNNVVSAGSPEWLAYYFASGTPAIASFSITARGSLPGQSPLTFSLQSSPDGSTWTTILSYTAGVWTSASTQTFTVIAPSISLSPASAVQGASPTVAVTGTATHFAAGGATAVTVSGTGVTVGTVTVTSAISLTVALSISPAAAATPRTLTVTTGTEAPAATFTVTPPPVRGNIDYDQLRASVRQGGGTKFQMFGGGAITAGNAAVYDAGGNVVDGGIPPGGGGGAGTLPAWLANCPDAYPATPGSLDDEFDGSSLGGTWSWINQGAATATLSNSRLVLQSPLDSGTNWRIVYQAAPATPWEVRAKCLFFASYTSNYWSSGMVLSDSSNRIIHFGPTVSPNLTVQLYNSPTSYNSAPTTSNPYPAGRVEFYLRIKDDGTNLTFYHSPSGLTYRQFYQVSRTALLSAGPTRVGLGVDSENGGGVTLECDWFRRTL